MAGARMTSGRERGEGVVATVKPIPNGPLLVRGAIEVHDSSGKPIATEENGPILLCRCGNSESKPLCDGSHRRVGFIG